MYYINNNSIPKLRRALEAVGGIDVDSAIADLSGVLTALLGEQGENLEQLLADEYITADPDAGPVFNISVTLH